MAIKSKYDFIGCYEHDTEAGMLHVANHHISPGKKQWTWGHGDFGQAWDRNLTDTDGPYIELMTGRVYRTLTSGMGMSSKSISRLFKIYLSKAPQIAVRSKSKVHLLIDGTYLPNGLCLILYYDHDIKYVQLYRTAKQEKFREIYQDLKGLKTLGVEVYSVTFGTQIFSTSGDYLVIEAVSTGIF